MTTAHHLIYYCYTMPSRYTCRVCRKSCKDNEQCLQCNTCNRWQHRVCSTNISEDHYHLLSQIYDFSWNCSKCSPYIINSTLPTQCPDVESTRLQSPAAANVDSNVVDADGDIPVDDHHQLCRMTSTSRCHLLLLTSQWSPSIIR